MEPEVLLASESDPSKRQLPSVACRWLAPVSTPVVCIEVGKMGMEEMEPLLRLAKE